MLDGCDGFVRIPDGRSGRICRGPGCAVLRRNLLIYGVGGLMAPFLGIKLIDLIITALGVH